MLCLKLRDMVCEPSTAIVQAAGEHLKAAGPLEIDGFCCQDTDGAPVKPRVATGEWLPTARTRDALLIF